MNDKKDAKISEATRKRVLQVANLLGYRANYQAIGLTTGRHHMIGIVCVRKENAWSRNEEVSILISMLTERLGRMGYGSLLLTPEVASMDAYHDLDGLIAIDLTEKEFREVSGNYYVPVLCLDMVINDFLFYQIYTDFDSLTAQAADLLGRDYYLVSDSWRNEGFQEYLLRSLPGNRVILTDAEGFTDRIKGLRENDAPVIAMGMTMAGWLGSYLPAGRISAVSLEEQVNPLFPDMKLIKYDLEKKANIAVNIMLNALEKKFDIKHEYKI